MDAEETTKEQATHFYDRPGVEMDTIPVGGGVPFGLERVVNKAVGIGGVYGAWGKTYDNEALQGFAEHLLHGPLLPEQRMNLAELGFVSRHHTPDLTPEEDVELEVEVGARFLREAALTCGWRPSEVDAILIGSSGPTSDDYLNKIGRAAGIPESALKVTIHKACDSSTSGLHLALNPELPENKQLEINLAERLAGKKVLVGGIEGLSRLLRNAHDRYAVQLFGNAAGIIGFIPGQSMKFLAGKSYEAFDEEGTLQFKMFYPHKQRTTDGTTNIEVVQVADNLIRVAGLMHEPENGEGIAMAGPMGMVKLFVRNGVQVVRDAYDAYQARLAELGLSGKPLVVAIVHHANYKINRLKEKQLQGLGISLPMPWLLSDFGNVSAASNMVALLRQLPRLKPGDNILIDGFGAGTYYDTLAVELGLG
jgi:3-oxoacyl-[acyl-carrier-protein] synthase III